MAVIDRDRAAAEERVAAIPAAGGTAAAFEADVSRADRVEAAVRGAEAAHGPATVLLSHAGTIVVRPFLETTEAERDWLHAVNVKSMVLMTRAVLPGLIAAGGGSIGCPSSISAVAGAPMEVVYDTTNGAVHLFARAVAVEFRDRGIRCNAVCPGFIRAPHGTREVEELTALGVDASEAGIAARQGRIGEPAEVARAALFLASDEASVVTGAQLFVDGGFTAGYGSRVPDDNAPDRLLADIALIQRLPGVARILSVCLHASGMGIAAIARVTEARWIACAVLDRMAFGLAPGGELPVETTLCGRVRDARAPIVIEHASREAEWCDHPTPRLYGYESHVSVPILLPDGEVFGTLVAIDPRPLPVRAPDTVATFTLFADLLALQIDAERRVEAARGEAALREQYIAVLGHDLRNPLTAIGAGVRFLRREGPTERAGALLDLVQGSADRMAGLIEETLDFARGRLGGGIPIRPAANVDLAPLLGQIVDELRSAAPDRAVLADLEGLPRLRCDPRRIGQLASNLLGNALAHGAPDRPVRLGARAESGAFTLWVENGGAPIPEDTLAGMFEPFRRGAGGPADGLGLGLYIASEIARGHGGDLTATTAPEVTRFTFTMPLVPA